MAVRDGALGEQPGFVGREALFARIAAAFARGARLVTLLGPPGVGKSRAARVFASASADPPTLLDDPSPTAVTQLLENDPAARLLVTSRHRLGLSSESTCEVSPLDCPAEDASDADILASESVRLLQLRIAAADGSRETAPRVLGELVRRLEGLPLALEIAAARTRATPPETWLDGPRDPTNGALATAFAWSEARLDPVDRRALATLAVFVGPFTLAAAEAVLGAGAEDRILSLRDSSLLAAPQPGVFALYAPLRERLAAHPLPRRELRAAEARHIAHYVARATPFNTSRMFTEAAPETHLRGELALSQANVVAALASAWTHDDVSSAATLAVTVTLLQAAPNATCEAHLSRALAVLPDRAVLARAALLLARQSLRHVDGRFAESDADFASVLALSGLPAVLRAETHVRMGVGLWYRTDYEAALQSHEEAERVLAGEPAPRLRAMSLACLGRLCHELDNPAEARRFDEASREMCRELGDRWLEGLPLANLAQLEQEAGHFSLAAECLREAFALFRETAERNYERIYQAVLGDLCFERGDLEGAREAYDHAIRALSGPSRPFRTLSLAHAARGALEARHGDRAVAEASFRDARASLRRIDATRIRTAIALHEHQLALRVARDLGDASALADATVDARARLAMVAEGAHGAGAAHRSIDVRFAVRMLRRTLDETVSPTSAGPVLEVGPEASFFAVLPAPRVSLLRRGPLRRLLATLATAHATSPGAPLSADRLIAAAWPEQKLIPSAASTRLRVGIATLRGLGLRGVLVTRDDGYLLDASWTVVRPGS